MKVLALSTLLVIGFSSVTPVLADATKVYNSKANTSLVPTASALISKSEATFDASGNNSKLGSARAGGSSVDVMSATFHSECSKCSS